MTQRSHCYRPDLTEMMDQSRQSRHACFPKRTYALIRMAFTLIMAGLLPGCALIQMSALSTSLSPGSLSELSEPTDESSAYDDMEVPVFKPWDESSDDWVLEESSPEATTTETKSAPEIQTVSATREQASPSVPSGYPCIPPRPFNVNENETREVWQLTLEDAIEFALRQNRDLRVERFNPAIANWQIGALDSIYDPVFQLGGEWARFENQVTNVTNGPGVGITSEAVDYFREPQGIGDQLRLSKRLRSGGEFKAEYSSNYQFTEPDGGFLLFNPAIRSGLRFQLDHNLGRGVGRDVNMVAVQIAQHVHSNAHRRLEVDIRAKVLETASAYWDLVGARAAYLSRQKGVEEAHATWMLEADKLRLGASAAPDVAEAKTQLERFRVIAALARKGVADAERRLRDLMGVALEDHRYVEPVSEPARNPPALNWEVAVQIAMELRPELGLQQSEIQMALLRKREACDRLKPNIRGYAGWGLSGAGDEFSDSMQILGDGDYASWWLGISYEHQFGRRRDRAAKEEAHLALQQQTATMDLVTREIYRELHDAFQSVDNAWYVIQAAQEQLEAADTVRKARREMYELGEIPLEDSLRALSAWSIAVSSERRAIADYNRALTAWEHAKGTILDYTRIRFGEENSPDTVMGPVEVPPAREDATNTTTHDTLLVPSQQVPAEQHR